MSVQQCDSLYGNPEYTEQYDVFHERGYRMRGKTMLGNYEIYIGVLFYRGKAVATHYVNLKGHVSDLPFSIHIVNAKGVKQYPFYGGGGSRLEDKRPHSEFHKEYMKTGIFRNASCWRFYENDEFIIEHMGDWGL